MTFMHEWSRDHMEFHSNPMFLFWCGTPSPSPSNCCFQATQYWRQGMAQPCGCMCSESYGGKMGAGFAKALARDATMGRLNINFRWASSSIAT